LSVCSSVRLLRVGFGIVAGTTFFAAACAEDAFSQPASVANGPELKVLYASSADIADGKHIVEFACAACHGANGISQVPGAPNLAGQRAPYLYLELKAYQSGARGASAMREVVGPLSDDAFFKVAAYFGSLDPPQPVGAMPTVIDPVAAGKSAAAGCAGCHGETGTTKIPGTPSLSGLDPKYLVAALKAYKSGQRKNDVMKGMVASISDANMESIALFYGLQKPQRAETSAAGDKTAGAATAGACAGCHGSDGVSGNPAIPSIAGQDAGYIEAALRGYKSGARGDETMKGLAASFDDKAIKNVAAYYADLQPKQPDVRKPLTADEWAQRCDRCHGINGNSTDPRLPALASQRQDYLQKVLRDYQSGTRKSPQMAIMSDVLTDQDISNLAAYYSHQKARGVVYVVLPPNEGAK
jgi:cytochrome c553